MPPMIVSNLRGFHHRVSLWLAKIQLRKGMIVRWVYPPLEEAMPAVGIGEVETLSIHRQNNVTHYIATRLILELCLAAEKRMGS